MDYSQFMKLMGPGGNTGKESIQTLQEFIREFPYFQTAHAMLAQTMHEQQHVRYEKQLKIASAYAGDRRTLYELIHPRPARLFSDKPVSIDSPFISESFNEEVIIEKIFAEEKAAIPPPDENKTEAETPTEYIFTPSPPLFIEDPVFSDPEESEVQDADDGPPVADPHEIIRRRLNEILGLKENQVTVKTEAIPVTVTDNAKNQETENISEKHLSHTEAEEAEPEIASPVQKTEATFVSKDEDAIVQIVNESAKAKDVVDKGELEYALEASLIQSLEKLPVIEKPKIQDTPLPEAKKAFTFYDWLKEKGVEGYGKIEEVHADDTMDDVSAEEPPISDSSEEKLVKERLLIDRFIESEPKIIPSKAEFFSPANQAKKSITESEDLVSETLAKIYHQQGNLLKARSSYQKLSLLYPEKMAYFAALISAIDKEINNPEKQDL